MGKEKNTRYVRIVFLPEEKKSVAPHEHKCLSAHTERHACWVLRTIAEEYRRTGDTV